jgi:hypothetical protein
MLPPMTTTQLHNYGRGSILVLFWTIVCLSGLFWQKCAWSWAVWRTYTFSLTLHSLNQNCKIASVPIWTLLFRCMCKSYALDILPFYILCVIRIRTKQHMGSMLIIMFGLHMLVNYWLETSYVLGVKEMLQLWNMMSLFLWWLKSFVSYLVQMLVLKGDDMSHQLQHSGSLKFLLFVFMSSFCFWLDLSCKVGLEL